MTKLERIAADHRVHIRLDSCGDPVIPGKNGHLYTDNGAVLVCFTDDGRKKPFATKTFKTLRMRLLRPHSMRVRHEGEYEFIAEIRDEPEAIRIALFQVLGVKRLKITAGVPRPNAPGLREATARSAELRAKTRREGSGDPNHAAPSGERVLGAAK